MTVKFVVTFALAKSSMSLWVAVVGVGGCVCVCVLKSFLTIERPVARTDRFLGQMSFIHRRRVERFTSLEFCPVRSCLVNMQGE